MKNKNLLINLLGIGLLISLVVFFVSNNKEELDNKLDKLQVCPISQVIEEEKVYYYLTGSRNRSDRKEAKDLDLTWVEQNCDKIENLGTQLVPIDE